MPELTCTNNPGRNPVNISLERRAGIDHLFFSHIHPPKSSPFLFAFRLRLRLVVRLRGFHSHLFKISFVPDGASHCQHALADRPKPFYLSLAFGLGRHRPWGPQAQRGACLEETSCAENERQGEKWNEEVEAVVGLRTTVRHLVLREVVWSTTCR